MLLVEGLPHGRGREYMERTERGRQKGYARPRPSPPPPHQKGYAQPRPSPPPPPPRPAPHGWRGGRPLGGRTPLRRLLTPPLKN